ncbi:4-hydroxythreonine-4-phosphate dehydrogenase 1 [Betaproteobacteria bacterium]|nr:4-hydroxythreonine-4-phosphate dehydrogenase 1 [Betaproteobacteria bacterium]GHU07295.1 4-hydroxythreonine-4-phosphate dehydrogenase 1 [Betaproteobacteria bacterium]
MNSVHEQHRPILAVTSGEPAGVGPELCTRLVERKWAAHLVVVGDADLIEERLERAGHSMVVRFWQPGLPPENGVFDVLHCPLVCPVLAGEPDPRNAAYVLKTLDRAIDGCHKGTFAGMVTAPVHKGVICDSGVEFSGHTEYLAAKTKTPQVVMMLVGGGMRVALATTHLPLAEVSHALTAERLTRTLEIVHYDLINYFGVDHPHILVAGFNPHAGEGGHIGREEVNVIIPVLERLRKDGLDVVGPLPADTLFVPHTLAKADAVLAMYHDQGLPVLKHASFGGGVNVTLGLPIIRTSVDHGTALDLVGTGQANPGSLFAAVELAINMVKSQSRPG